MKNRQKFEALEVEKEKEVYLTHEIRTPLTLIKGPLLTMEKNTNRLLELTNQLLDFRKTDRRDLV